MSGLKQIPKTREHACHASFMVIQTSKMLITVFMPITGRHFDVCPSVPHFYLVKIT